MSVPVSQASDWLLCFLEVEFYAGGAGEAESEDAARASPFSY